jgi:hypothetical protein
MTKQEKLEYAINTEVDMYINLLQERMIEDRETRNFVCRTVIPRFNRLKAIVLGYKDEEDMFTKDIIKEEDC